MHSHDVWMRMSGCVQIPYMGQFTGLLLQCSGYYSGILRVKVTYDNSKSESHTSILLSHAVPP